MPAQLSPAAHSGSTDSLHLSRQQGRHQRLRGADIIFKGVVPPLSYSASLWIIWAGLKIISPSISSTSSLICYNIGLENNWKHEGCLIQKCEIRKKKLT